MEVDQGNAPGKWRLRDGTWKWRGSGKAYLLERDEDADDEDDTYIMMKCLYVVTFLLIFFGGKIILAGGKIILAVNSEYHYY